MATYGQGVLDAVQSTAGSPDPLHSSASIKRRQPTSRTRSKPLVDNPNIDFIFSFKYAKAHVYQRHDAAVSPRVREGFGRHEDRSGRCATTTCSTFAGVLPDFVREFVKNIPYEVTQGYYFGSDQYIWGREFLQRDMRRPPRIGD